VHIPFGHHTVRQTLTVPASDIQIVGDGYGTSLKWEGAAAGPVLRLLGPSRATVREIAVYGTATVDGIVVAGVDQDGSRVHLDGVQLRAGEVSNLLVDRLDRAHVQAVDIGHAYSPRGTSVRILGGPDAASGRPVTGRTTIFSGASSGHGLSYEIASGATALVRDVWYEGDTAQGFAYVHDGAHVTFQGLRASTPPARPPAFLIANAGGRTSLINIHLDDRIALAAAGAGDVLAIGLMREFQRTPLVEATVPPRALFVNNRQRTEVQGTFSVGTVALPNIGTVDETFLRSMLATTRSIVSPRLTATVDGTSDVRMFRVWVANSRNNLVLTRD
jgi:hypothetical protein